ncbi:hypothetical protein EDD11_010364 [Mortierella claussenii]|nr:hypothetical protein EDD11_010364 [Mortierella claussenii]
MAQNDAGHAVDEFREPASTLELNTNTKLQELELGGQKSTQGLSRTRLLMDSDDDMQDDDLDDEYEYENTLLMPLDTPKVDLHIDQTLTAPSMTLDNGISSSSIINGNISNLPSLNTPDFILAKVEPRSAVAGTLQLQQTQSQQFSQQSSQPASQFTAPSVPPVDLISTGHKAIDDDDDGLFGEDFMAQFGEDGELNVGFDATQSKKALFPRRLTLLEATSDEVDQDAEESEDLGLERLRISQKHRTLSGGPVMTETTTSTHTATSSTTITSAVHSRLHLDRDRSTTPMPSQMSSQYEEELLEMSARQRDAMLDDMILEDEQLRTEEVDKGVDDMLLLEMYEQDMQQEEQQRRHKELLGFDITSKRKHTTQASASSSSSTSGPISTIKSASVFTTTEEVDQFLKESYAVGESSLARANENSKKSRLEHASTGANFLRPPTNPTQPTLPNLSKKPRAPEPPKHDYTLPPETGSFIKAKSHSGQTFYLAKRVRTDSDKESSQSMKSLLSMPIHRMMDELDAEIRLQKQEAINRLEYGDYDQYEALSENNVDSESGERLWVDKYRPKIYTDLMGDERVNREVLSWIKEWDQCVFGRKYKKFTSEYKQQRQQQQQQHFKDFRKPDPLGRPERKILMLTGPPGLGKTTMAHVIAKQAGYNVIEVNASDDRTGASVKGKIESALEIQSILGNNKPNLLIIDEIDGVSSSGGEQSFIKLLVDIATVEVATKEERMKSAGKRNKKFVKKPLMRPIICICNDQYAPVLRPLRVIAQIYQFKRPSIRSVVARLQQICEVEQVASDTRAFGALYEMTEGDMRSCLNTLQFIKNKSRASTLAAAASSVSSIGGPDANSGGQGLTLEALNKATIGRKDQSKSLFSVWEELFQAPYARKARSALKVVEEGRDGPVKDDTNAYVSRMATLIQTNGDYEKLMQGCFENYPNMIFHDVAMSKIIECGDWLAFYDQLNAKITTNFEYEVGGYVAYALVNFHRFFAGSVRQKIEYPRTDYESFVTHKANESILQGMALNLPAKAQRHFRKRDFATELLSPFLRILSPYLRPVNKQLIKPNERAVLQRLVDIMIHFQLTFVQEKTEDGQFLYRLEPSIEKLGDFSGIGLKNVLTNRYAVRQLVAQEIEVELVRRSEEAREARMGLSLSIGASVDSVATASLSRDADGKDKEDNEQEREAVDFFGRVISKPEAKSNDSSAAIPVATKPKKTRIWYKFNEGFSNAVKAKVFISELL